MTPLQSIRKNCLRCANYSPKEVKLCPCVDCDLYHLRMGKKEIKGSAIKRIRQHCLDCQENAKAVRFCSHLNCYLYAYRMGKSPAHRKSCLNRHPEANFKK